MASARGSLSAKPIDIRKITVKHLEKLYACTTTKGDCVVHNSPHHTGYSYTRIKGVRHPAHRVVKAASIGDTFVGLVIDHLCKNKACLRVSHLEVVTQGENIRRGTAWHHFQKRSRRSADSI